MIAQGAVNGSLRLEDVVTPSFTPALSDMVINALVGASLTMSLLAALGALVARKGIVQDGYLGPPRMKDKLTDRRLYLSPHSDNGGGYMSRWHPGHEAITLLLMLAVGFFLIAFYAQLLRLCPAVAYSTCSVWPVIVLGDSMVKHHSRDPTYFPGLRHRVLAILRFKSGQPPSANETQFQDLVAADLRRRLRTSEDPAVVLTAAMNIPLSDVHLTSHHVDLEKLSKLVSLAPIDSVEEATYARAFARLLIGDSLMVDLHAIPFREVLSRAAKANAQALDSPFSFLPSSIATVSATYMLAPDTSAEEQEPRVRFLVTSITRTEDPVWALSLVSWTMVVQAVRSRRAEELHSETVSMLGRVHIQPKESGLFEWSDEEFLIMLRQVHGNW